MVEWTTGSHRLKYLLGVGGIARRRISIDQSLDMLFVEVDYDVDVVCSPGDALDRCRESADDHIRNTDFL